MMVFTRSCGARGTTHGPATAARVLVHNRVPPSLSAESIEEEILALILHILTGEERT